MLWMILLWKMFIYMNALRKCLEVPMIKILEWLFNFLLYLRKKIKEFDC